MLLSFLSDNGVAEKTSKLWNGLTQIALLGKGLGQVIHLQSRRIKMANARQEDKSNQGMEDAARRVERDCR